MMAVRMGNPWPRVIGGPPAQGVFRNEDPIGQRLNGYPRRTGRQRPEADGQEHNNLAHANPRVNGLSYGLAAAARS